MGGRLSDWLGTGLAADRPAAAGMAALLSQAGVAFYFSHDDKILHIYDDDAVDWYTVDIAAISAIAFSTLPDVDWSTPPADGQVFAWNTGSSKLVPLSLLYNTAELFQDAVGAMGVNGTGTTFVYDDGAGTFTFNCTITQYTDELAQDALAAAFAAGTHTGFTVTYDDVTNKFDFAVTVTQYTDELAQDAVGGICTDSGLIVVTYTDGTPELNFNVPAAAGSDFRTGTDATKALTSDAVWDAAAYVTLNDSGGNIALDLSTGVNFEMTMDGDYTLSAPSNGKPGQTGVIVLTQDGTGTQTLTYNAAWKFAGGTDPVLSTAANAKDLLFYLVMPNGTDVYGNLVKAIA